MTYKRILVPVDGSATSNKGLDEAMKIARARGARIRLLHVVDDAVALSSSEGIGVNRALEALRSAGEQSLAKATERVRRAKLEPEVELVEKFVGRVAEAVVERAKRWRADLIVMGTHGRRGFSRLVMGSNAELVARYSTVPVLLVPGSGKRG